MKYQAKIIKREFLTISADGNLLDSQPTSEQKLMDGIFSSEKKFMGIELYSVIGDVKGKTLSELNNNAWKLAEEKNESDIELFIIK